MTLSASSFGWRFGMGCLTLISVLCLSVCLSVCSYPWISCWAPSGEVPWVSGGAERSPARVQKIRSLHSFYSLLLTAPCSQVQEVQAIYSVPRHTDWTVLDLFFFNGMKIHFIPCESVRWRTLFDQQSSQLTSWLDATNGKLKLKTGSTVLFLLRSLAPHAGMITLP
jgi:hypothetical protein